jgi:hypothetical protein
MAAFSVDFLQGQSLYTPFSALSAHGVIARPSEAPHWTSEKASDGSRMYGASTALRAPESGDQLVPGLFEK